MLGFSDAKHGTPAARGIKSALAWFVWFLAVIYVVYKFQTQSSFAVINTYVAESLALTLVQIGQLGAAYSITYAAMTILAGGLLDRYGARIVLSMGVATVAIGALVFGLAKDTATVFAGQALMGIGGAFGFPGLAYLTRYWFDLKHFGLVFGVAQTVAATANTIGQAAVGYLILVWTWQEIRFVEAAVGVALLITFLLFVTEPNERETSSTQAQLVTPFFHGLWRDLKQLTSRLLFWQIILISGLTFGTLLGIGILWGIKLLVAKGFDATTASSINSTIWLGFGIGAILIHTIADFFRSFKVTSIAFLILDFLALVLLTTLNELSAPVAYALFLSIGFFAGVSTMCYTMTTRICEKAVSGTAFGVLTCISFLIGAVLMPLPGTLIERFDLSMSQAAWIFAAAIFLSLLISVFTRETYGEEIQTA